MTNFENTQTITRAILNPFACCTQLGSQINANMLHWKPRLHRPSVNTKKPLCELILQATLDNRQLTTVQRSSLYHDIHWFTPFNDTPNDTTYDDDNLSSENEELSHNESFYVEKALMQAWFMRPVKNTAMKVGSANEKNVLSHLSQFVECHSQHESSRSGGLVRESTVKLPHVKEYGLLCHNQHPYAAFSPDDIAVISDGELDSSCHFAGVEIKTRTVLTTEIKEKSLGHQFAKFCTIQGFEERERFAEIVPDLDHRGQVLHLMLCGSLSHALLVYASQMSIIRVVYIQATNSNLHIWCHGIP
jgi:hypothetical protein